MCGGRQEISQLELATVVTMWPDPTTHGINRNELMVRLIAHAKFLSFCNCSSQLKTLVSAHLLLTSLTSSGQTTDISFYSSGSWFSTCSLFGLIIQHIRT